MGRLDTGHLPGCELCEQDGGHVVVRTERLRVIRVNDPFYPAFYRVIWHAHRPEFTDLAPAERHELMEAVGTVEHLMRQQLRPDKVNLASLGNMVPHLHWHLIARFSDDRHFPQPIWGEVQRPSARGEEHVTDGQLTQLDAEISAALQV